MRAEGKDIHEGSAKDATPAPSTTVAPGHAPTGYRIAILPTALEISARLATAEELQTLVKILQANAAIWAGPSKGEC